MFKFGYVAGGLRGIIAANFIPMTLPTPQTWNQALNVPKGKDGGRARASELLPRHSLTYGNANAMTDARKRRLSPYMDSIERRNKANVDG